jgi:serine/threonine protein kinase/tetratricopeptide (TPR) repeat protein
MIEEELFHRALEKPTPAEQLAFLDQVCADQPELRQRVERLLRSHRHDDSFLHAGATVDLPAPAERAGAVIGPYKLVEQIGEGGMGTVWMAQQTEPVKRLVAVKLIKAGMDSKQVIARFEAERQALALMDHPNIAKVLDAGTVGKDEAGRMKDEKGKDAASDSSFILHPSSFGRPYFVMELVKGVPITKYCDEHHLTPRQRLELFLPVCQAIQHAHQKGIIHRDLKPSNVLVAVYDGKPVPKVIDFGVAKAAGQALTDKTLVTGFGAIVGTLEYMSPEQAEVNQLDIDTRSDIYSLGVLLYELLTGSPPFTKKDLEKAGMLEMLRVIREQEPSKPSTKLSSSDALPTLSANRGTEPAKLTKLIRGELDWIVMKALEKDRNRRYETANGFAMDVQRYLADEAVQACPPSAVYRLRKFVRRNKTALVTMSVGILAVLLVVGGLGWMVRDRTAREEEIARDLATRQTVIKERATLALDEARKRHQEGRWKEALNAAKRAEALTATGECDEETRERAREVLGDMQMLANLENVRVRSTQNQAGFDLKEEDSGNARAFREYGIDIDALDREEAVNRIKARPIRYELAVLLDSWSHVRRRLENPDAKQTGKNWKELLEIARAADPDPWRDHFRKAVLDDDRKTLVELAASAPVASLPVETVDRLGDALRHSGAIKEAAAFLKKGQRLHAHDYWITVNLADCLFDPQEPDEAIRYYTAAVALRPEAQQSLSSLANALAARAKKEARLDEAAAANYRKSIRLNSDDDQSYYDLAVVMQRLGRLDEAADFLEKTRPLPSQWRKDSALLFYLSKAHARLDEKELARDFFDRAVQWRMSIGLKDKDLRRLGAEAAALLGLDVPPALKEPPVLTTGPTLVKPAAGAMLENRTFVWSKKSVWEFGWSEVPGATRYHLYVVLDGTHVPTIHNSTLTSSSYQFETGAFVPDQNRLGWRWKVRALVQGTWTDWSEERTFDVTPFRNKSLLKYYGSQK